MDNTHSDSAEPSVRQADPSDTLGVPEAGTPGEGAAGFPRRIGDFTILRVLGEGGMGTVYLAEDGQLGRKAAVKTMKPELAARPENRLRFVREARAAAAIDHDNVVPIWQVGQAADGSPFIAMPFLQGEMLESRLNREAVPDLGLALKVAGEVAEGLAAAHAAGLTHRDIKASNVWLEGDPAAAESARQVRRCKILDFGLARSAAGGDARITGSGTILGTPSYMAPEQASGGEVDQRTDLFSLGVLLYRMTTGRLPFEGPNVMAVLSALANATPPPARSQNPNVPQKLSDLIGRLMSKDPAGRPASAEEVAVAVRRIAKDVQAKRAGKSSDDTLETELDSGPRPGAPVKRSRTPWLVALALLALLPLGWLAAVILRVETDKGTLIVEIKDADTEARIKGGRLILAGPDGKARYTLSPGERDKKIDAGPYTIRVEGADGLTLFTQEFTLKKAGKVTVRVTAEPKAVARKRDPDRVAAEWVLSIGGIVQVNGQKRQIKAAADLPPDAFRLTESDLAQNHKVSDAGLAHFKDCKNLTSLSLSGDTQISDAGLAHLRGCKKMAGLYLSLTKVSDPGLASFENFDNLSDLILQETQVGDDGVANLKGCKNLTQLSLVSTRLTDAGLAHLKNCKNLTHLWLQKTKVTAAKVEELKKALPRCKIEWDGGVIEPRVILDPDHKAAEWVLSIGGMVKVNDVDRDIKAAADLPREAFRLTLVWLYDNKRVSDAGLIRFKDCKDLMYLYLANTRVSDAGLAHFKDCKNLTAIGLGGTQVSDMGVAYFEDCKNLTLLYLDSTKVGDAGLVHFKGCRNLTTLDLRNTQAGDVGLTHLEGSKRLTHLLLQKTKVTAAKVEELKKALPRCKIEWDGGVIEPRVILDPDRKAAEWVLSIGGTVHVNGQDREIKAAVGLPREEFRLTGVWLQENKQVGDAGLAHFEDCKNLTVLYLNGTKVGDAGLALLKGSKNLTHLWLGGTQVTDAGLAHFKDCKNLTGLDVNGTSVGDAGLAHLKDCKSLAELWLGGTKATDAGLAPFQGRRNVTVLDLWDTKVGDAGVAHFRACAGLTYLDLNGTKVSDAGLSSFKGCKKLKELRLQNTRAGDLGVAHFKDCKDLTVLDLSHTKVGDAGLAPFADCKKLASLNLTKTKVTKAKVEELKKALPKCKIEWDGGVIEPKAN